ncbi:SURF1 family protein [Polaromonas jejuensis]|uniref:SURF1-like protein n=1 Tax=Polaromonas jejuensis TaxID=457502 RepID=A0ABW0Q6I6_9BURK|nr:SURF1 family protein [Polaromonas jejuensis]
MIFALKSPRFWVITLATLLVAGATFSLGQWQLRRAAQKQALQAAIESRNMLPALDGKALAAIEDIAKELHRRVSVQGVWQPAQTIYLDNRPMDGRSGFWVLTPLSLQGSQQVVLVQRGWAPRNFSDRTRLPDVATPTGVVTVEGRIAPAPSKLYEFKGEDSGRIRQNLDLNAFRAETGLPLLNGSLLQTGAPSDGLLRDWPAPNLGVEKHYGYAFQWFGMCGLVLILYVWFQLILPLRKK